MTTDRTRPRRTPAGPLAALGCSLATLLAALVATLAPPVGLPPATAAQPETASRAPDTPAVVETRVLGRSVLGRPIRAFRLGDPEARVTAVVLGSMHGDERAGMQVVDALRRGRPVQGVDLWVIPTMNPDGVARDDRHNAHGVDLNRNFGHEWAPLTGYYYAGPRRWSEPESRAVRDFLSEVRPRFVVSFHQPLHGIGRTAGDKPFQRRLSRGLGLPIKAFNCTGRCTGTMTSWYNARHRGTAVTVEFGSNPRRSYLRGRATRGTLAAVHGWR